LARATSMKLLVFGLLLIRAHSVVNPDPDQIPRADQIPNTPGATPDNAAGPVAPPADPVARVIGRLCGVQGQVDTVLCRQVQASQRLGAQEYRMGQLQACVYTMANSMSDALNASSSAMDSMANAMSRVIEAGAINDSGPPGASSSSSSSRQVRPCTESRNVLTGADPEPWHAEKPQTQQQFGTEPDDADEFMRAPIAAAPTSTTDNATRLKYTKLLQRPRGSVAAELRAEEEAEQPARQTQEQMFEEQFAAAQQALAAEEDRAAEEALVAAQQAAEEDRGEAAHADVDGDSSTQTEEETSAEESLDEEPDEQPESELDEEPEEAESELDEEPEVADVLPPR